MNHKLDTKLESFLNKMITNCEYDYNEWWKNKIPFYESISNDVYTYYDTGYEEWSNLIDLSNKLNILSSNIQSTDEENEIDYYTQHYTIAKPICINPMSNLYHANMLFRKLIDEENAYNYKTNTYSSITTDMRTSFYKFCMEFTK
jgi:hypothetical protein